MESDNSDGSCEDRGITGWIVFVVWLLMVWFVGRAIWQRRSQLVGARGVGVGADIGHLHDVPRVHVDDLTMIGPEVARLALTPATSPDPGSTEKAPGGVFLISMSLQDPGFAILQDWLERRSTLGLVMPPDSSIIRLRSLDDLQPITLRRVDC